MYSQSLRPGRAPSVTSSRTGRSPSPGRSRRGTGASAPDWQRAGYYEQAFRVIGRYLDERRPRDIFFFEQGGAFVVRILGGGPSGGAHELIEFTREDVADLIASGPALRTPPDGGRTGNA